MECLITNFYPGGFANGMLSFFNGVLHPEDTTNIPLICHTHFFIANFGSVHSNSCIGLYRFGICHTHIFQYLYIEMYIQPITRFVTIFLA